jgi:P-type Cu2+ transporter
VADVSSTDPDVLERAARLALSSHHPLAAALARRARERIPYAGVVEECGSGVRGNIEGHEARLGSALFCGLAERSPRNTAADGADSTIFFTHAGQRAAIPIRQRLRPDAVAIVQALIARSLDLIILSGDRRNAVEPIAQQLGIAQWHAGLSPAEKIAVIEKLKSQGRRVLMVGDGLNDAPALAAATVSLSPITAAQLTQARADALFLGDYLAPLLDAIAVSRRAKSLMQQNLGLAVVYNALAVPIAVAGMVTPLIAAVAMSGSSILVTMNALRGRLGRRPDSSPVQTAERLVQGKTRVLEDAAEQLVLKTAAAARNRLEYVQ